jgi:hypothetical protein
VKASATKHPARFLILGLFTILLGIPAPCLVAQTAATPADGDFRYAAQIVASLREKTVLGSGFYYRDEKAVYLVTARHVLFGPTQVDLADGAGFPVPRRLGHRMHYDTKSKLLSFDGVLSVQERDDFLMQPSISGEGRKAVLRLYEKSQSLKLRAHTATAFTCSPGTGELEMRLTAMLIKGLIKYHPSQDVVVLRIGTNATCAGNGCIAFVEEVTVRKPENTVALGPANLKPMSDVEAGSEVSVFGYTSPGTEPSSPKSRQPLLRHMAVAAKNRDLGIILLDGLLHHGESGGLVMKAWRNTEQNGIEAVGIVSGVLRETRGTQPQKVLSIVVALDAVMELLKE